MGRGDETDGAHNGGNYYHPKETAQGVEQGERGVAPPDPTDARAVPTAVGPDQRVEPALSGATAKPQRDTDGQDVRNYAKDRWKEGADGGEESAYQQ